MDSLATLALQLQLSAQDSGHQASAQATQLFRFFFSLQRVLLPTWVK